MTQIVYEKQKNQVDLWFAANLVEKAKKTDSSRPYSCSLYMPLKRWFPIQKIILVIRAVSFQSWLKRQHVLTGFTWRRDFLRASLQVSPTSPRNTASEPTNSSSNWCNYGPRSRICLTAIAWYRWGREREVSFWCVYDRNANACDPKHNKRKITGNKYLSEILSQQKQFCPLVRPDP